MRLRIITLVLLIVSIFSFSYYARKHYFKIPPSLDDIDDYAVTYIFGNGGENEEFLESCLRKMEAKQVIMVVTATGENKSKYESTSFKAVVKHVYKGENYVSVGDEIEILNQYMKAHDYDSPPHIEEGFTYLDPKTLMGTFTNLMEKDKDYLVFVDSAESLYGVKKKIFCIESYEEMYLCLENINNTVIDNPGISIRYELVKNNEFFAKDREHLDMLLNWKKEVLKKYEELNY